MSNILGHWENIDVFRKFSKLWNHFGLLHLFSCQGTIQPLVHMVGYITDCSFVDRRKTRTAAADMGLNEPLNICEAKVSNFTGFGLSWSKSAVTEPAPVFLLHLSGPTVQAELWSLLSGKLHAHRCIYPYSVNVWHISVLGRHSSLSNLMTGWNTLQLHTAACTYEQHSHTVICVHGRMPRIREHI